MITGSRRLVDHDVRRFQIAVDNAAAVGFLQGQATCQRGRHRALRQRLSPCTSATAVDPRCTTSSSNALADLPTS